MSTRTMLLVQHLVHQLIAEVLLIGIIVIVVYQEVQESATVVLVVLPKLHQHQQLVLHKVLLHLLQLAVKVVPISNVVATIAVVRVSYKQEGEQQHHQINQLLHHEIRKQKECSLKRIQG